MRIAIDIDSTLHHYWDRLSAAALRRFGIDLPYEEQLDWGITRLRPDQLKLCIDETHGPDAILAGAKPVFVQLEQPDWKFDPDKLRAAFSNKTRAIVVNTPHNPTGRVFTRE